MPYGYNPTSFLPPPPDVLPLAQRRPTQMASFPEAAQGPVPQMGSLPPPPGDEDNFKSRLLRALPTLGAGLLGAIGGPKSALGNFGMGGAVANSRVLMADALQRSQQRAQEEQNTIKYVHEQMDKVSQLPGPEYQSLIQEYQLALEGGLTGKEALKIQQKLAGLGGIEGKLKQQQQLIEDEQFKRRAEIEQKIKQDLEDRRRNSPIWADGRQLMVTPEKATDYFIQTEQLNRQIKADEARDRNAAERVRIQMAGLIAQEKERGRRQDRFSAGKDIQFTKDMSRISSASIAIDKIEKALESYLAHPSMETGMLLNAQVNGFTTMIGRSQGEGGQFTDRDRVAYGNVINPGIVITTLKPEIARALIGELKNTNNGVRQRDIEAYALINPDSAVLDYYRQGLDRQFLDQEMGNGAPVYKTFRDKKTGQPKKFRLEGGQWVPAQ